MTDPPLEGRISVRPLDVPGAGRAFPLGVQVGFVLLTLAALAAGALAFLLFWGAFWFVAEALRLGLGVPYPLAPAWLIVPALLAAWGVLYLATDRLAMLGSAAARETLRDKSGRFFAPWGTPPSDPPFFVEARVAGGGKQTRMDLDLGMLYLLPERLLFVGDGYLVDVPRDAVRGRPRRDRSRFGLSVPYLSLPLPDDATLRLLCRDDAARQSETSAPTRRLESALARWLAADYGAATADTHPPSVAER